VYPFNNKYDPLELTEILGWIIYWYILTAILQLTICVDYQPFWGENTLTAVSN